MGKNRWISLMDKEHVQINRKKNTFPIEKWAKTMASDSPKKTPKWQINVKNAQPHKAFKDCEIKLII